MSSLICIPAVAASIFIRAPICIWSTISNNAAVALMFSIAQAAALARHLDFMPLVMAVVMGGSASFATPIGYQTNLMVYGPGAYTFRDFLRIGVAMNLAAGACTVVLIPWLFPFAS